MRKWDIEPGGVYGVLRHTGDEAEGLAKAGEALGEHIQGAAMSAGSMAQGYGPYVPGLGAVAAALGEYFKARKDSLLYLAARTWSSTQGASTATQAYQNGSLEMAANAQKEASKEPDVEAFLKAMKAQAAK
ncbi:DUF6507 family protein [Streptomyces sp. NPDC008313]|uniref:DUF6507 family protein n=1 Tax=Streptomyces sp. NPDC008313 TaxID=3364826 RepID=UPI0036E87C28